MPSVVCAPCQGCKYTDCAVVCPVECFYQDDVQLYIDPLSCTDCDACLAVCPVHAIYRAPQVPSWWLAFIELNARKTAALQAAGAAPVTSKQLPLMGVT